MVAFANEIKITDIILHYLFHSPSTSLMLFPIWNLEQFVRKRKIIYYAKITLSRKSEERNCAITVEEIDFVVFIKHVVRWQTTRSFMRTLCNIVDVLNLVVDIIFDCKLRRLNKKLNKINLSSITVHLSSYLNNVTYT